MYSEDILLRSLQPKLMLPMTRNMPKSSASEGNINPPPNKGGTAANVRKGTSSKSRTTAEIRRYKMVESLRVKENCIKGFKGGTLKSNPESLHSLLPLRKVSARPGSYSTGFTVRSYRNPNTAEILAEFEPSRPKTVPVNQAHQRQPLVPAPYFFKHFNKPRTANSTKKRNSPVSQPEGKYFHESPRDQFSVLNGEKIFGAPGTGTVSRSLRAGGARFSGLATLSNRRTVSKRGSTGLINVNGVNSSGPLELRAEGVQLGGGGSEERANQGELTGHATHTAPSSESGTGRSGRLTHNTPIMDPPQRQTSNNGTIRLDLENEDGKKQEIYLDDAGELDIEKARESEAKVASMQEDAKQRKKELEHLLQEHDEIVKTIVRQSSHDSSQDTFQSTSDASLLEKS
ncbi:hypothetical protein MAR_000213 [Mya arenaria]|uniref:Uncharacterized protein n=1 Tax=Mya arenaria TaxID=6604 RepID=A0ABY7F8C7_MYAAR|nr:hypothetical protein MAR_000213 [Mya arenaria]